MPFFKKKPVIIEALQYLPEDADRMRDLAQWLHHYAAKFAFSHTRSIERLYCAHDFLSPVELPAVTKVVPGSDVYVFKLETLEGEMSASPGDWIVRGIKGEFYPVKPEIFAETYEVTEVTGGD